MTEYEYGTIETHSGRMVNVLNPDPATICLEDIAYSLARQIRFNGHCSELYTVAHHSIACAGVAMVEQLGPVGQLAALMHDAAEAYLGDIITPVKCLFRDVIKPVEDNLNMVIWRALVGDLPYICNSPKINRIDRLMLATEAHHMMPSNGVGYGLDAEPDSGPFIWMTSNVEHDFLVAFDVILSACGESK